MRSNRRDTRCIAVESFRRSFGRMCLRSHFVAVSLAAAAALASPTASFADEDGVSFWIPGLYGSLAAAPQVPGWAVSVVNLYNPVSASGNVAAAREVTINRFSATVNVNLNATLKANPDLGLVDPTYVFTTPVFGGQLAVGMAGAYGRSFASIDGTLTLTGPAGGTVSRQGAIEDGRDGFSDLYPQASLRWNRGVNNFMIYGMGDIPVGTYDSSFLANTGIGHGAADSGIGYTYFDQKTGHEFSVVTGLTYNLINPSTGYQNGIDWHLDWGASQFVTKTVQLGAAGYFYQQITADSGCAPVLCPFMSRTTGIGPQAGYLFPAGEMQGYVNLKAYWDFDTQDRASGWSAWVTLSFSPKPPESSGESNSLVSK